ncbi:MAG: NAD(P)/FAD-dependent oxidoreductase, partial [Chloroflexi bacterium]|nr:NAD(P)/FAD-dependent oxidoreductase [Chloroflexota bacterium]
GIHFLMGHRPGQPIYDLYSELGTAQANRFLDMTTYGRFFDEASGCSVDVTGDLDRLASDLKALSPADARIVDELMAGARVMQGSDMLFEMGMGKPPELIGPLDQLKQLWGMRRIFKYFTGRYAKPAADYAQAVHDPLLRQILENLFLPEAPVWLILMLLALLADRQIGLLEGGCLDFVLPIEKRYKALGGQVTYEATVEEILVENDRAVGVRLADGSEHRTDIVVSAADGYSTIFKMLGGRYVDEKIKERYRTWKLIRPTVMVSFGVARVFLDDPPLSIIMLKNPFTIGSQAIRGFSLRIFNYGAKFAPPGKTVIQAMLEMEWDFWNDLQKDRPRYEVEKERVATEVLVRLEAHYPGISSQVEMTDVATPYTTWHYTLNHKGAYVGWLPTPEAIMTLLPRTLPGLANFYMAGQWVMPGGGVPPCLYSGRHVVQILCRRDGKPFVSNQPSEGLRGQRGPERA